MSLPKIFTEKKTLLFLFALASLLRLFNLYFLRANDPFFLKLYIDHAYYDQWALSLLKHGFWEKLPYYTDPFYPFFLSIIYFIFGHNYIVVFVIQCLMGGISCILIYQIGKTFFNQQTGWVAALIFAIYSPDIFYSVFLTKVPITILLFLCSVYFLGGWKKGASFCLLFLSGFFLAASVANRGNFFLLVPLFILAVFIFEPGLYKQKILSCLLFALGFSIAISPWTIRNYIHEKDFILVNQEGGISFYLGNNPWSTGTYTNLKFLRPNPKYEHIDFDTEAKRRTGDPHMTRSEVSRFWYGEAFKYIKTYPRHFRKLLWKKISLFFNYFEIPDNKSFEFQKRYSPLLKYNPITFGLLVPIALAGMFLSMRKFRTYWFLISTILIYAISIIAFFLFSRYRIPILPLMILFAAHFIIEIKNRIRDLQYKKLIVPIALLLIFYFFINRETHDTDFYRYHQQADLAYSFLEVDRCDDAIIEVSEAIKIKPGEIRGYNILSRCYMKKGNLKEARKALLSYLNYHPDDVSVKNQVQSLERHIKMMESNSRE